MKNVILLLFLIIFTACENSESSNPVAPVIESEVDIESAAILNLNAEYNLSGGGNHGYEWNATIKNTGNIELTGARHEQYGFMPGIQQKYMVLGVGDLVDISPEGSFGIGGGLWDGNFKAGTYNFTINLFLSDGTLIDSKTDSYTIP